MENTNQTTQEVDKSEEILAKARANKKTIMWCLIIAAVCVVGMLAYILVAQNGSRKADELIAKADAEQNDSIALNLYAKAQMPVTRAATALKPKWVYVSTTMANIRKLSNTSMTAASTTKSPKPVLRPSKVTAM